MEIERYVSPDGVINLVVNREGEDFTVGFDGTASHTHGDVLIGEYAIVGECIQSPEVAVNRYVNDILTNRIKICVYRVAGQIRDVVASPYETGDESKYLEQGETIDVRYWK